MPVTHFDKGAGDVRALIAAEGKKKRKKKKKLKGRGKKQQFDVSYYVSQLEP